MKRSKTLAVLAVLSASLAACAGGAASLSDTDIAAIEEGSAAFVAASNASDWGGVAALYTEDAVMMGPNGPAVQGRAAIEAFFAAFPPTSDFALNPVQIDGHGDLAFSAPRTPWGRMHAKPRTSRRNLTPASRADK